MRLRSAVAVCTLIVVAGCNPRAASGQTDPYWLRSWEEAQKTRPTTMASSARIALLGEPGMPMVIRGQVLLPDGRTPAEDIVVHSYHRDARGFDFGAGDRALTTWRLQGWAKTDAQGRFEFHTIRPAADHLGRDGPHVHFTLDSRQFGRQWAPTLFLTDGSGNLVNVRIRLKSRGDF